MRIADPDTTGKIQYLDQWYDKEALSGETITWLEWYNSLSEEEQLMVDSVPSELYELTDQNSSSDIAADAEWDMPPMIMVNNTYYYDTNQESTRSDRSDNIDGIITSTVGAGKYHRKMTSQTLERDFVTRSSMMIYSRSIPMENGSSMKPLIKT